MHPGIGWPDSKDTAQSDYYRESKRNVQIYLYKLSRNLSDKDIDFIQELQLAVDWIDKTEDLTERGRKQFGKIKTIITTLNKLKEKKGTKK